MTILLTLFLMISVGITAGSFGFVDVNLPLPNVTALSSFIQTLSEYVRLHGFSTAVIYGSIVSTLFVLYILLLFGKRAKALRFRTVFVWILVIGSVLALSFPALTYDLFNYMTTARVTFFWHENPYVVMPIEISNESYLAFTRAANKVALYGPAWILFTFVPYVLGSQSVWQTIFAFKLWNLVWYVLMVYLVWRQTREIRNVILFAANPLILLETLVSGHNDLFMMVLAIGGILLMYERAIWRKIVGFVLFILSIFVKVAPIALIPFLFVRSLPKEKMIFWSAALMAGVFVVFGPIREELYPWYAVWFFSFLSLLPFQKYKSIIILSIAFCFGLSMRHIPYMASGSYLGLSQTLRTIFTVVPVLLTGSVLLIRRKSRHYDKTQ